MTTGFEQRYKGKIVASQLWVKKGGIYDPASGVAGSIVQLQRLSLPVTATANTDYTMAIPPGAAILGLTVYCTTAYTGNTVTIQVGSAAAGSQYVGATDIKGPGIAVTKLTMATTQAAETAMLSMPALDANGKNLFVRIVQTATTTNVGAGYLVVKYFV